MHRLGLDWFTYRRLIRRAGGAPFTVSVANNHPTNLASGSGPSELPNFDGLLLGGGVDVDPSRSQLTIGDDVLDDKFTDTHATSNTTTSVGRDQFELQLIKHAIDEGCPVLGICRGCQLLNVALGGTLRRLPPNRIHRNFQRCLKHPVAIRRHSRLHEIIRTRRLGSVRSLHDQVVDRLGAGVRIVARAADQAPEAIQCNSIAGKAVWFIGVQWHPELISWGNPDQTLVSAFVEASKLRRLRPPSPNPKMTIHEA
jgi:putative glutamine amidotransferase